MKIDRTMSPADAIAMARLVEDGACPLRYGCDGQVGDDWFEVMLNPINTISLSIERGGMELKLTLPDDLLNMLVCGGALILAERTRRENELRERNAQRRAG